MKIKPILSFLKSRKFLIPAFVTVATAVIVTATAKAVASGELEIEGELVED